MTSAQFKFVWRHGRLAHASQDRLAPATPSTAKMAVELTGKPFGSELRVELVPVPRNQTISSGHGP